MSLRMSISYYDLRTTQVSFLVLGWGLVLVALFVIPSIHTPDLRYTDYPAWLLILSHFGAAGYVLEPRPLDMDTKTYAALVSYGITSFMADGYFVSTILFFVCPGSWLAR